MKKILSILAIGCLATSSYGSSYTWTTTNLQALAHGDAYTWGLSTGSGLKADLATPGEEIVSAKLVITKLWDWINEPSDSLQIDVLNNPASGTKTFTDHETSSGDYFASWNSNAFQIADWNDPKGGSNGKYATTLSCALTDPQIDILTKYLSDPKNKHQSDFGIGFDPDCHYFDCKITFEIDTGKTPSVPDGGISLLLLGLGLGAIASARRFFRA